MGDFDFDLGSIFNFGGMFGGGASECTQGAPGSGSSNPMQSIESIVDAFSGGDIGGGIQQILGMASGGGSGGMDMLGSLPMDPLTRNILQGVMQQGYAKPAPETPKGESSFENKMKGALDQVGQWFDLLDTASGKGGKDGLIGRCDLEVAVNDTSLPRELREACRFLLENAVAFNHLETAAGLGECDGLIGKCDVEAALAAFKKNPAKPEPAVAPEKRAEAKKAEGQKPEAKKAEPKKPEAGKDAERATAVEGTEDEADEEFVERPADVDAAIDADPGLWSPGGGKGSSANEGKTYVGMSPEEIVESMMLGAMDDLDGLLIDRARELCAAQKKLSGTTDAKTEKELTATVARLQMQMQKLLERRNQMFSLLSNLMNTEHEMARKAIDNIGRI